MASGDSLLSIFPGSAEYPASGYATFDSRNVHPLIDFDDTTDEYVVFRDVLPNAYDNSGLTVKLIWVAATATSGNVVWNVAFERINDEGFDIDADGFATAQSATAAAPSTSGYAQYTSITFTDGAQMDSLAAGELFRIKVLRDADNASDTMTGDAELMAVIIEET